MEEEKNGKEKKVNIDINTDDWNWDTNTSINSSVQGNEINTSAEIAQLSNFNALEVIYQIKGSRRAGDFVDDKALDAALIVYISSTSDKQRMGNVIRDVIADENTSPMSKVKIFNALVVRDNNNYSKNREDLKYAVLESINFEAEENKVVDNDDVMQTFFQNASTFLSKEGKTFDKLLAKEDKKTAKGLFNGVSRTVQKDIKLATKLGNIIVNGQDFKWQFSKVVGTRQSHAIENTFKDPSLVQLNNEIIGGQFHNIASVVADSAQPTTAMLKAINAISIDDFHKKPEALKELIDHVKTNRSLQRQAIGDYIDAGGDVLNVLNNAQELFSMTVGERDTQFTRHDMSTMRRNAKYFTRGRDNKNFALAKSMIGAIEDNDDIKVELIKSLTQGNDLGKRHPQMGIRAVAMLGDNAKDADFTFLQKSTELKKGTIDLVMSKGTAIGILGVSLLSSEAQLKALEAIATNEAKPARLKAQGKFAAVIQENTLDTRFYDKRATYALRQAMTIKDANTTSLGNIAKAAMATNQKKAINLVARAKDVDVAKKFEILNGAVDSDDTKKAAIAKEIMSIHSKPFGGFALTDSRKTIKFKQEFSLLKSGQERKEERRTNRDEWLAKFAEADLDKTNASIKENGYWVIHNKDNIHAILKSTSGTLSQKDIKFNAANAFLTTKVDGKLPSMKDQKYVVDKILKYSDVNNKDKYGKQPNNEQKANLINTFLFDDNLKNLHPKEIVKYTNKAIEFDPTVGALLAERVLGNKDLSVAKKLEIVNKLGVNDDEDNNKYLDAIAKTTPKLRHKDMKTLLDKCGDNDKVMESLSQSFASNEDPKVAHHNMKKIVSGKLNLAPTEMLSAISAYKFDNKVASDGKGVMNKLHSFKLGKNHGNFKRKLVETALSYDTTKDTFKKQQQILSSYLSDKTVARKDKIAMLTQFEQQLPKNLTREQRLGVKTTLLKAYQTSIDNDKEKNQINAVITQLSSNKKVMQNTDIVNTMSTMRPFGKASRDADMMASILQFAEISNVQMMDIDIGHNLKKVWSNFKEHTAQRTHKKANNAELKMNLSKRAQKIQEKITSHANDQKIERRSASLPPDSIGNILTNTKNKLSTYAHNANLKRKDFFDKPIAESLSDGLHSTKEVIEHPIKTFKEVGKDIKDKMPSMLGIGNKIKDLGSNIHLPEVNVPKFKFKKQQVAETEISDDLFSGMNGDNFTGAGTRINTMMAPPPPVQNDKSFSVGDFEQVNNEQEQLYQSNINLRNNLDNLQQFVIDEGDPQNVEHKKPQQQVNVVSAISQDLVEQMQKDIKVISDNVVGTNKKTTTTTALNVNDKDKDLKIRSV